MGEIIIGSEGNVQHYQVTDTYLAASAHQGLLIIPNIGARDGVGIQPSSLIVGRVAARPVPAPGSLGSYNIETGGDLFVTIAASFQPDSIPNPNNAGLDYPTAATSAEYATIDKVGPIGTNGFAFALWGPWTKLSIGIGNQTSSPFITGSPAPVHHPLLAVSSHMVGADVTVYPQATIGSVGYWRSAMHWGNSLVFDGVTAYGTTHLANFIDLHNAPLRAMLMNDSTATLQFSLNGMAIGSDQGGFNTMAGAYADGRIDTALSAVVLQAGAHRITRNTWESGLAAKIGQDVADGAMCSLAATAAATTGTAIFEFVRGPITARF